MERNGLDPAEVEDVQMGCVSQVGEQGWNIGADGAARRGLAGLGPRHDRRPAVRLVDAVQLQRRGRGLVGPARRRRRRRGRVDVARADGLERRRRLAGAARALGARPAGDLGRADRRGVGALARGARRVLVRVAPARAGGDRGGPAFEREVVPVEVVEPARGRRLRRRRDAARRHVARGAGGAEAGLPPRREGDGRELEPDLRRRRGRARRERGRLLEARPGAARAVRLVRPGRRRPAADAARQPAGVRARARAGRPSAGTTSPWSR